MHEPSLVVVSRGYYGPAYGKYNAPDKLRVPKRRYSRKEVIYNKGGAKNKDCRENNFYE
jgi:hypothetical protein